MASNRCPECGAAHQEPADLCRLCGAPLNTAVTVRTTAISATDANRANKSSVTHFIWIGLAIVIVFTVGALALGFVENPTLERWVNKLPFIDDNVDDAWFSWVDPDEVMIVEVPALPEAADTEQQVDLGGDTSLWTAQLGDIEFLFGHTEGLDADIATDDIGAATDELNAAVDALAEQQGGVVLTVGDPFTYGDHYGVDAVIDGLSLPEGPAFGSVRMIVADGELVVIETIDYEAETDYHQRISDSLVLVADNPDIVLPTVPDNVAPSDPS
jgi:hypothetical protein